MTICNIFSIPSLREQWSKDFKKACEERANLTEPQAEPVQQQQQQQLSAPVQQAGASTPAPAQM